MAIYPFLSSVGQLSYEVSGAGEPVVLVGGTGMPPVGWDAAGLRPALVEAGYQVLTFASRGVAPSAAPPPPYSVEDLSGDLAELLDHLGMSQCRVVGLSLGASSPKCSPGPARTWSGQRCSSPALGR
jgi:pimeloyl-ACP methyl ester carboxylesterase